MKNINKIKKKFNFKVIHFTYNEFSYNLKLFYLVLFV